MTAIQEQLLGQNRPPTADAAVSLYSPGASETAVIKSIAVCNQTASASTYRIFLDNNGTTYDASTALFYDVAIAANETHLLNLYWPMNDATGNLATSSGDNNAVTFTAFGLVIS